MQSVLNLEIPSVHAHYLISHLSIVTGACFCLGGKYQSINLMTVALKEFFFFQ